MIVRAKRNTNFTIISNVGMNDTRLSFKARGILAYLLTKPDHWQVSDRHLATVGPDGRSAVQAALKELENAGYLRRTKHQNEQGHWIWTSTVYDEPWPDYPSTDYPATEKPSTDYPATENQAKVSTDVVSTDQANTERSKDGTNHHAPVAETEPRKAVAPHGDENAAMLGNVYAAWQDNIGMVGPIVSDQIKDLVAEVGARSVIHGITIAAQNNKRAFNYVQSCARNHANGTSPTYRNGTSANHTSKVARSMDAVDRVFAQLQEAK